MALRIRMGHRLPRQWGRVTQKCSRNSIVATTPSLKEQLQPMPNQLSSGRDEPSIPCFEDPFELRCNPRLGTDLPVQVYAAGFTDPMSARTRDMSIGGTCIATDTPFDFKSVSEIDLLLEQGTVRVQVEGCWQRSEPSGGLVLTGVRFSNLTYPELDVIWSLVMKSGTALARFLYKQSSIHEFGLEEAIGLAQVTRFRDVQSGHTLYRQGTRVFGEDSIYLIVTGSVVLQVRVRDAIENEISRLGPGELFGGLPLLAGVPHCESAITYTNVRLLEIDNDAFRYIRTTKPWLGQRLGGALLRVSAERFHQLMNRVADAL